MNQIWKKRSEEEIKATVFRALGDNVNYNEQHILGVPATYLDDKVFYQDASFVKDAPFISTLIKNPNHIGCHTLGKTESFFSGTQAIEKELIEICAVDILKGEKYMQDGYVASGGTEANIQAIWIYRNYFMQQFAAQPEEISILCSSDSHYSMDKAANVLMVDICKVHVDPGSRTIPLSEIKNSVEHALEKGKKYFIVICNMMTTMFGSIDNVSDYVGVLEELNCKFKIHVDGAFGGFYSPFTDDETDLTFSNPHINSFTLDAHKMAQAPYGTGIFLIRKGFMKYAQTPEASYVEGDDYTLIGSRSGANAIAVWMILVKNGPYGWHEKIFILQKRTEWMCNQLDAMNIDFYRHPRSNIITIKSEFVQEDVAKDFGLVPDRHKDPNWFKIVIMEHVTIEKLLELLGALEVNVEEKSITAMV